MSAKQWIILKSLYIAMVMVITSITSITWKANGVKRKPGFYLLVFENTTFSQIYLNVCGSREPKDNGSSLSAMYHKRTQKLVKTTIEKEFCKPDGIVRVLFCSIAFGMGVNVRKIYLDIHIGPSADLDDYLQETGRIGRDSTQMSHAVLHKLQNWTGTKNISKDMRSYVNNTTKCRREYFWPNYLSHLLQRTECCNNAVMCAPWNVSALVRVAFWK